MYEVYDPETGALVCDGFATFKTARRYCEIQADEGQTLAYRLAPVISGRYR